jgi:hypothetical protein
MPSESGCNRCTVSLGDRGGILYRSSESSRGMAVAVLVRSDLSNPRRLHPDGVEFLRGGDGALNGFGRRRTPDDVARLIAAMSCAEFYPHRTASVEFRQTLRALRRAQPTRSPMRAESAARQRVGCGPPDLSATAGGVRTADRGSPRLPPGGRQCARPGADWKPGAGTCDAAARAMTRAAPARVRADSSGTVCARRSRRISLSSRPSFQASMCLVKT